MGCSVESRYEHTKHHDDTSIKHLHLIEDWFWCFCKIYTSQKGFKTLVNSIIFIEISSYEDAYQENLTISYEDIA